MSIQASLQSGDPTISAIHPDDWYVLGLHILTLSGHPSPFQTSLLLTAIEKTDLLTQLIDAFPPQYPLKRNRGDIYAERVWLAALFTMIRQQGWSISFLHEQLDQYVQGTTHTTTAPEWHELNESPEKTSSPEAPVDDRDTRKEQALHLWAAIDEYERYQVLLRQHNRHEAEDVFAAAVRVLKTYPDMVRTVRASLSIPAADPILHDVNRAELQALLSDTDISSSAGDIAGPYAHQPAPVGDHVIPWLLQRLTPFSISPAEAALYNLLTKPVVSMVLPWLQYFAAEHDVPGGGEALLFEILHAPWLAIPAHDIALITIEVSDRKNTDRKTSLRRLLFEKVNAPAPELFAPPVPAGIEIASKTIEKLSALTSTVSLPALWDELLTCAGIQRWACKEPEHADTLQALGKLIQEDVQRHPQRHLIPFVKLITLLQADAVRAQTADVLPATAPTQIAPLDTGLEKRLLQKFVMNVSALNNYLHCPLEFYYRQVLRIPAPQNEAAEFGSAIHYALEQLFRNWQNDRLLPSEAAFIQDFETYLHSHRTSFTQEQFNRRLQYGHTILTRYYRQYQGSWNPIVIIERSFRNVMIAAIPLKGRIDKLEFDGRKVTIVDYKTGDPLKIRQRLTPPSAGDPTGSDYWRQAVFYKLLVENQPQKNWLVQHAAIDCIEPDRNGTYHKPTLFITDADTAIVTQQITNVWEHIRNSELYTGCGKPECYWCQFVRLYGLAGNPQQEGEQPPLNIKG